MADIGMAAFSVFFMQSPSFLAHQRHLAHGILPLGQASLSVLLDAQAQRRQDRIFP